MIKNFLRGMAFSVAVLAALPAWADYAHDKIVVAVQALPGSLEPTQETSIVSLRITYSIYDKLIDFAVPDSGDVAALAESWSYNDDKTALTLKLREGVKFHNGEEMTAEDVAFTFGPERMTSEGAPAYGPTRSYFGDLVSVDVIDPHTVRMNLAKPDGRFHYKLGIWTGEIISKKAYLEAGGLDEYAANPVGTGPYMVESVKPGESIVLHAFDDHFRGTPTAERIEFRQVPEVSTRIAGLLSGEFDIITNVPPDQLGTIDDNPDTNVVGGPILNHIIVAFKQNGTNPELMNDVHFRRALSLAIDRQLIVDTIWGGRTIVPAGHQWREFGDLYIDRPIPAYDPEKAKQELALSSYKGEKIAYPMLDYYTNGVAVSETMTSMWKAVGIDVDMTVVESVAQRDAMKQDFQDWSNSLPYPDPEAGIWRLWKPATLERLGIGWDNKEFIRNGEILESSNDTEERRAAFSRMLDIWDYDDPGGFVLYQNAMFYGKKADLDWTPYPIQFMDFGPRNLH